jgi:hypothetical protein
MTRHVTMLHAPWLCEITIREPRVGFQERGHDGASGCAVATNNNEGVRSAIAHPGAFNRPGTSIFPSRS